MGCDIHAYVEYKEKEDNSNEYWWGFGGQINPGRDYTMFGILAGVRYHPKKGFDPRGIPNHHLSWAANDNLYLYITEDGEDDNSTTLEQAKLWGKEIIYDDDGKPFKVKHPDWHSHSWLTTKELAQAYKWYEEELGHKPGLEYRALLKLMKALEDNGKNKVIVVFWFDN